MTSTQITPEFRAYTVRQGDRLTGSYMGDFDFAGTVTSARANTMNWDWTLIHVRLDEPQIIAGSERKGVCLEVRADGTDDYGTRVAFAA